MTIGDGDDAKVKEARYPIKYRVKAYIFADKKGEDGEDDDDGSEDVNSFVVIRAPLTKTASFATITTNMKMHTYLSLEEHTRQNRFQLIQVDIDIVPNMDDAEHHRPWPVDKVMSKQYLVLHMEPLEPVNAMAPYVMTVCFLVHPVLYYLQITNGFNKILEDVRPIDALQKYEKYCADTFGKGCFQWQHVGEDHELNDFRYEQILTRHETDLMIPTTLIVNYKLWNTFGYHFFDDFRFDGKTTADITGWLVNLGNLERFEQKNMFDEKSPDISTATKFINSQAIVDHFNVLYQEKPSIITKGNDIQIGFKKSTEDKEVPQIEVQTRNGKYNSAGICKAVQSAVSGKTRPATEHTIIYAPDRPQNAINRFEKVQNQLRQHIHVLESYYMHDCHIDFIQFGNRYNMIPWAIDKYLHVPMTICNMFIRDTGRVPIYTHNMKFQMFKFLDPTDKTNRQT